MRAATKPLRAVAFSLALAASLLPAAAQESAPSWQKDNPIFRQGGEPRGLVLPPAQQRVFDRDAASLADIRVELAEGEYRHKAGEIDPAAWRSRADELQAAETALRRKWQGIGTGQDLMLSSAADSIARARMAALRAQYAPPIAPLDHSPETSASRHPRPELARSGRRAGGFHAPALGRRGIGKRRRWLCWRAALRALQVTDSSGASGVAGLGFMPCGTEPPRWRVSAIR
jgi:hypothetical protein